MLFGSPLGNQPAGTWACVSSWEPDTTRRIDCRHVGRARVAMVAEAGHPQAARRNGHGLRESFDRHVAEPGLVIDEPVSAVEALGTGRARVEVAVAERPPDLGPGGLSGEPDEHDLGRPEHPANTFDFTVGGGARSQGIEAALTGDITRQLSVAATYAYTDAAYRQNSVYGFNRVPNVARHSGSVWAQYAWGDGSRSGGGIYVQSRRFADEANTTILPGYARLDLVQSWSMRLADKQAVELQLALRNVFDKKYDVSSHLHVSRWITPGQGRNAMLSASYRF